MSRIILKISGGILKVGENLVDENNLHVIYECVNLLKENGHSVGIVIGGGNFFRGREHPEMDKVTGDTIGMLGTVMNALYVKDYLEKKDIHTIVSTPFSFPGLIKENSDEDLRSAYNSGCVIVFGGGVGKSGYSTDSGTILASNILECDLIIKLTNVDGVYTADPNKDSNAKKLSRLTYDEVIENNYEVMDMYAIKECKEKNIKILVINFYDYEKLNNFSGENIGTLIGGNNGETISN